MQDCLDAEIKRLDNVPLEEGPGEGYHRSTNVEKVRASASRLPWVLANTREESNIARCLNFSRAHGPEGAKVVRFEFENFKRVLQPTLRRRFAPLNYGTRSSSASFIVLTRIQTTGELSFPPALRDQRRRTTPINRSRANTFGPCLSRRVSTASLSNARR